MKRLNPPPPFFPARPVNGGALETAIKLGALNPLLHGERFAEPKYNGWRAVVHTPTGAMWNRHGNSLSIAAEFQPALARLHELPFEWLDCEALERRHGIGRGSLIVLDIMGHGTYRERRTWLEKYLRPEVGPDFVQENSVFIPPSFPAERALEGYGTLQLRNADLGLTGLNSFYEGIVLKSADSLYPRQRISAERETPAWVKHRFA